MLTQRVSSSILSSAICPAGRHLVIFVVDRRKYQAFTWLVDIECRPRVSPFERPLTKGQIEIASQFFLASVTFETVFLQDRFDLLFEKPLFLLSRELAVVSQEPGCIGRNQRDDQQMHQSKSDERKRSEGRAGFIFEYPVGINRVFANANSCILVRVEGQILCCSMQLSRSVKSGGFQLNSVTIQQGIRLLKAIFNCQARRAF